jgi:transposase
MLLHIVKVPGSNLDPEMTVFLYCDTFGSSKLFQANGVFLKPLNAKLNPICHLLALVGAHHIFHVSRIRVIKYSLTEFLPVIYFKVFKD